MEKIKNGRETSLSLVKQRQFSNVKTNRNKVLWRDSLFQTRQNKTGCSVSKGKNAFKDE